jgi:hypothetical protein
MIEFAHELLTMTIGAIAGWLLSYVILFVIFFIVGN